MTEKDAAIRLYTEIIKFARINGQVLSLDDYKIIAEEAILQARVFLEVYRTEGIPDDILNIP